MSYGGKPVTLPPQIVVDNAYIANANEMMAVAADSEHEMFGKEYVLEDGHVTEVHTEHKKVIGGVSMVVTTEEVIGMAEKLGFLKDNFFSLADGLDETDFALKAYYSQASEALRKAEVHVRDCLRFMPKTKQEEVAQDEAV